MLESSGIHYYPISHSYLGKENGFMPLKKGINAKENGADVNRFWTTALDTAFLTSYLHPQLSCKRKKRLKIYKTYWKLLVIITW